ncbi:MAG TPA: FecR domain-containing protein [Bacteroidales bacterium]|jgi:ferric-dicitrate binding protein FerR (iron transport regulator)|nr:FecR domain-containing protein [Bacteroidales bacterium]
MENRNLLENLLNKYLSGKLTISERRSFFDLLATDSNETVFKELILNHISEFTHENSFDEKAVDFDSVYKNILSDIKVNRNSPTPVRHISPRRKVLLTLIAAAVMAAIFLLGRLFPASQNGMVASVQQVSYTEVKSPYGSRSEIKLPDGTEVILNAGSTLKYRNDFNMNNRDINLYGEGYFKVAKNASLPLVVSAGHISIKAVGTEFNIKAYPEENTIETTLIQGKVEIANSNQVEDNKFIDLEPNQKAIFYKDEEEYTVENANERQKPEPVKPVLDNILISPKADVEKTVAWTEGKLIFRGENLENLSIDLQRKYDVKIVFIDEGLKKFRFTGVLLDETLEQVMNVIKLTAPIGFSIEGKTVYLFTDPAEISGFEEYMK